MKKIVLEYFDDVVSMILLNKGDIYEAEMIFLTDFMRQRKDDSRFYHEMNDSLEEFYNTDHGPGVWGAKFTCENTKEWVAHLKSIRPKDRKEGGMKKKMDSLDAEIANPLRGKCSVCRCPFRDGDAVSGVILFDAYGRHIAVDIDKLRCGNCSPMIVRTCDCMAA